MNVHTPRQLVTGVALAGTLAFVAACSGPSSSMNPTSPSATASAAAGASFNPNGPDCVPPEVLNPITGLCEAPPPPPESLKGRFTGGGFQIIAGDIKVTRGFTIHCDNILTNNLEINWAGGNNFHMTKNTLAAVTCSKPRLPNPPAADVSRIDARAVGTCNGLPAAIHFVLEDRGEPGTSDRAAFTISGGCSLNVPEGFIDGGNIQAHFDQPHKR